MLIKRIRASDPKSAEITPRAVFEGRRRLFKGAALAAAWALAPKGAAAAKTVKRGEAIPNLVKWPKSLTETPTAYELATTYNNFYEFGFEKEDPARRSGDFKPRPWTVAVEGHAEKTGTFDFDDLIKPHKLEERVYRFRCVEAWSMVVPWVGVPLGDVLKTFKPTEKAKYVAFQTVLRPEEMPGQRLSLLNWPYVEGLRMDEAMHPLALLTVGMYGEWLPNQNGAPLRLILPWKYGFKSIKSIARIAFTETQPPTSWNVANAREYGFYSNVNPKVDHPRWTQATERRIGDPFFSPRRPTPMFNGYEEDVAHLYKSMDLAKLY